MTVVLNIWEYVLSNNNVVGVAIKRNAMRDGILLVDVEINAKVCILGCLESLTFLAKF